MTASLHPDDVWHVGTGLIVVKVHAAGVEWWESHDLPPTLTIGCTSLDDPKYARRKLVGGNAGRHYVYRVRSGFFWRSVEADSYFDNHTTWTRVPPHPSKYWIDEREPALVDWLPDPQPMTDLARGVISG